MLTMHKLICFIELKWNFSDIKLYSPCIQLSNYSEDKVLYIGYRLLKKRNDHSGSLDSYISQLYYL